MTRRLFRLRVRTAAWMVGFGIFVCGCGTGPKPPESLVEAAVQNALDYARIGGSVQVRRIKAASPNHISRAELLFKSFEYGYRTTGELVSKSTADKFDLNVNSDDFFQNVGGNPDLIVHRDAFSGQGEAVLSQDGTGTWRLDEITFADLQVNVGQPLAKE